MNEPGQAPRSGGLSSLIELEADNGESKIVVPPFTPRQKPRSPLQDLR